MPRSHCGYRTWAGRSPRRGRHPRPSVAERGDTEPLRRSGRHASRPSSAWRRRRSKTRRSSPLESMNETPARSRCSVLPPEGMIRPPRHRRQRLPGGEGLRRPCEGDRAGRGSRRVGQGGGAVEGVAAHVEHPAGARGHQRRRRHQPRGGPPGDRRRPRWPCRTSGAAHSGPGGRVRRDGQRRRRHHHRRAVRVLPLAFGLDTTQARAARTLLDTDGDGRITGTSS